MATRDFAWTKTMPNQPADRPLVKHRQLSDALADLSARSGQHFRTLTTLLVGLDDRLDAIDAAVRAIRSEQARLANRIEEAFSRAAR